MASELNFPRSGKNAGKKLGFAYSMPEPRKAYSPKWWLNMVIHHDGTKQKNHLDKNPRSLFGDRTNVKRR